MMQKSENNHPGNNNSAVNVLKANTNIVFIDTAVIDYQSLIAGIIPSSEVVILDNTQDAITQITEFLAARKSKSVQSVHIVSHGSEGSLQLGSTNVNLTNLDTYTNQLQKWRSALTDDADILLYGCDVASGEGTKFVQQISQITEADVAASTDKTGSAALEGDWNLEFSSGEIEASLAFESQVIDAYNYILPAPGGVSFTGSYSQNFDSLANSGTPVWADDSTIAGWYSTRTTYNTNNGNSNTGALYSFGSNSSTERALGSVASGTTGTIYYGLRFTNNTGSPLTTLRVSYIGEQWRNGGNATQQKLSFSYQTGTSLTSLTTGAWTPATSLDFTGPIATTTADAQNGNAAENQVVISFIINLATPINDGEEIILRWEDPNDTGNDHGLAIDNVTVISNNIFLVTNTNNSGAGSLREAIINANNALGVDTILFDTTGIFGDATPDMITLTSGQLNVTEEVIIQGTGTNKLTISGNNASRVFNASASLTINDLKITRGNAGSNYGGGIYSNSSVALSNTIISGNSASFGGGILTFSSVSVSNSTFSGNTATQSGGGIYSVSSSTVSNSTFSGNSATNNGGGILSQINATIGNSTFSGNSANYGGGIFSDSGATIVSNSTFSGNSANTSAGGIYSNSTVTASNSIISGNSATYGGGILAVSSTTVNNSTVSTNSATFGGGIYGIASVNTSNSTISGNTTTQDGGGIYSPSGIILNSTITNNTADSDNNTTGNGGGIFNSGSGTFSISNSIIAGNFDKGNEASDVFGQNFTGNAYNLIGNTNGISSSTLGTGTDIINSNPGLKPLGNYGGSTQTHALNFNSPAFNAGDPNYNGSLTIDQRGTGYSRIQDSRIDIGAFENDSIYYVISTNTPTLSEGNSGSQSVTFTVSRSGKTGVASTIDYAFSGTAIFESDYNRILVKSGEVNQIGEFIDGKLSGTLKFAVGEKTKKIIVDVLGDNAFEPDENITVTLSNPNLTAAPENSTIITSSATVDIINDDNQPTISISDVFVTEDNTGKITNANFAVTLSNPSSQQVIVNYNTSDDSAKVSDLDYNSGLGLVIFEPGETSKAISLGVRGDNKVESNETFSVNLYGATNAAITDSLGVVTIINDDTSQIPTINISDVLLSEGNAGLLTNFSFDVTLSNASSQQITVNYSKNNGTTDSNDFYSYSPGIGIVIFEPGETTKSISFGVKGDNTVESNEKFFVDLFGSTNAAIAKSEGVATIINDDNQVGFFFGF
ncbi:DUF4347 domain-containing protein [Nostoc sp. MG11]|uniref:DUF4347 domain-containing protein n=1 Tax=Nostoc sp. MG11 TaxID=2721166 RepID=UPI0018674AF0|nr:DUF4347 domain-containing protein [Nostoc sp. MG11]